MVWSSMVSRKLPFPGSTQAESKQLATWKIIEWDVHWVEGGFIDSLWVLIFYTFYVQHRSMHKYGYVSNYEWAHAWLSYIKLCTYLIYTFICILIYYKIYQFYFIDVNLISETTSLYVKLVNFCLSSELRYYTMLLSSIFYSLEHRILCTKLSPTGEKHNFGSSKDQELAMLINISINHYLLLNQSFKCSHI